MRRKRKNSNMPLLLLIAVLAIVLVVLLVTMDDIIGTETQPSESNPSVGSSVPASSSTPSSSAVKDTQAPVITGAKDLEVYVGDAVSYKSGVSVTDDMDAKPELKIDNSKVDLTKPGVYEVTYTATDAAGNTCAPITVKLTVKVKPENFVDPEVIYAKADSILAQFIRDDMTDREKAEAVYVWTRRSVHLPKGDCFYFFAVQKLLLQRLNIPTIDCEKIYDGDSHHYWLLVSVDGGKSYYHFDNVWSKELCLVTDAQLNAFSAAVDSHPFNRNESLYPATPTEKLPASTLPWDDPAILAAKP